MDGPEITIEQPEAARPGAVPSHDDHLYDFFISYSAVDRPWAEWIAWTLEEAGYSTIIQAWDCLEGMDFVDYMIWAREHSRKTLALLSRDYLNSPHCMEELKAAYVADPSNELRLLIQLRVAECTPRILAARVYGDLFGIEEAEVRKTLSQVFGTKSGEATSRAVPAQVRVRRKPAVPPPFPGIVAPPSTDEDRQASPQDAEDERIGILPGRLLNAFIILLAIGTLAVCVPYFLGSKAFQDRPEDAYWDRMFNFNGDDRQSSEFGFGPGLIIEVLRQIVLLFVALIAMPLFSFKESARMLILGTPARRMLGIGPGPGDGTMTLEARIEFLTLSFFLAVGFVFVQVHHFYQGPHELWQTEGYRDGKIHGYDLQVMSPLNDVSGIPTEGEKLVIVAIVGHVLHFRIFDDLGKVVVDTDEKRRTEHAAKIDELKRKLPSLWLPHELTESEKAEVIPAVTTIVDHSLKPLPGLKNGAYLKRCLIPYAFYSVYSLINYLAGVSIVLTLSVHAGISDLLWMNRWSGDYRQKCDEGIVGVMVLHRRFEREFLVRLGAVLERYYALLVFLLTGFAFKLWLDHINLSPRAYEFEFYAMAVGTTPLIAAYLVSTIFYRSAAESAASRAQAPEVFRSQHRLEDFYGKSIKRSMYLPISLLLLASIAINFVWELAKRLLGW